MITEDYVSFEIAKLLKEKGFNEPCIAYWFAMTGAEPILNDNMPREYYNNKGNNIEIIGCPTLQMAIKWLREVYMIDIVITPSMFHKKYNVCIYKNENLCCVDFDGAILSPSYEEAVEASIKYCLDNLI